MKFGAETNILFFIVYIIFRPTHLAELAPILT